MKFSKVYLLIFSFILCFLFIVPLSGAEQLNDGLTKQIVYADGREALKGSPEERGVDSVLQAVAPARQMTSSMDVKIPLNERCNAIISLEKPYTIEQMTGRDMWKNYNALVGFQIILR